MLSRAQQLSRFILIRYIFSYPLIFTFLTKNKLMDFQEIIQPFSFFMSNKTIFLAKILEFRKIIIILIIHYKLTFTKSN
ncbi:MAG: hypothetical protein B7Y25_08240 [Alphaproteobacteria bacterium 16-39-46]|nr:MAG: hypothetical protein B7Y25_08240 [Alphaproteobacteria bacterium 16-39-46]OZA41169.1 MAG: hypothetical protein B7X84_08460 [Alphaproteobacteria bacterium 17-39-52]